MADNTIALISDIHGNVPALEAVLDDIRKRGVTHIICLGDLAGKGPEPDKAVDLIRENCRTVIQGNWDDKLGRAFMPSSAGPREWQMRRLGPERLLYLKELPFSCDFWLSGMLVRLFHASSRSVYHRVLPDSPMEERKAMFRNTKPTGADARDPMPDLVGCADIHEPYLLRLDLDGPRMLFNTGSVGLPYDIPLASYTILEGRLHGRNKCGFSIQTVRVPYDIEASVRIAKKSRMPQADRYIDEVRTAIYKGGSK